MNGLNFIARNGIKALVALVAIDVVGVPTEQYLAASPSPYRFRATSSKARQALQSAPGTSLCICRISTRFCGRGTM
jgi:hypothetical protein